MKNWLFSTKGGLLATAIYVLVVVGSQIYRGLPFGGGFSESGDFLVPTMSPNEWGDYLAGTMSPLALAWFVATLFAQKKELELQRKELEQHRAEMKVSNKAFEDANLLARSEALRQQAPVYFERLDNELKEWFERMPSIIKREGRGVYFKSEGAPFTVDSALSYLVAVEANGLFIPALSEKFETKLFCDNYMRIFSELYTKAQETENLILIDSAREQIFASFQGQ